MSKVTVYSDSTISVNGTITGYCVRQTAGGTKVLAWHNNGLARPRDLGSEVALPASRYVLSTPAGLAHFEADFLTAWNAAQ